MNFVLAILAHLMGLTDTQLKDVEAALPATSKLVHLANDPKTMEIIRQAQSLYADAQPLLDEALKEWATVGPALDIVISAMAKRVRQQGHPITEVRPTMQAVEGIQSIFW